MVLPPPFDVIEPQHGESPVLVEVPHAGLSLDPETLAWTIAPAASIARDADLYVDALMTDAPAEGATLLVAKASRYVVDLNRGEGDCDVETVEGGGRVPWPRGVVWRLTTEGAPILIKRLPRSELERRLEMLYRPYHDALRTILERKRAKFGFAMLLCAHSMPTQGRRGHRDPGAKRADLVPGTRGRTSASGRMIDLVDDLGRAQGWTVRHDDPYRGGFSTGHYGRPSQSLHAVQIELARRLYMDEITLGIDVSGFSKVREFSRSLVAKLGTLGDPAPPGPARGDAPGR